MQILVFVVLAFLWQVSAHSMRRIRRDDAPKPLSPIHDPFYVPPKGWDTTKPGTILATRTIQAGFTQTQRINLEAAYQILYRTSGTDPSIPSYTVTTVLVPQNARKNKLVMIMPYQDSNFVECNPSYKIQLGAPPEVNVIQSVEELMWTSVLNDGWIVTIPDHEGPTAAFSSGYLEGYASLDAVRATLNFDKLQMDPKSPVVGTGYSGGAIAGGWAASLLESYAPDINMAGWAIGGTPSNSSATFYGLDGGLFAGFAAAGIAGIVGSYPKANDYVGSVITPEGNGALQFTREHCMGEIIAGLKNVKITSTGFMKNANRFLEADGIQGLLNMLSMGADPKLTPKVPIYMYHATNDEVIMFPMANRTATLWCQNGANIQFQEYTGLEMGHVSTEILNTPFVLKFIRERMDGKPFIQGCQWQSTINPMWQPDILGAKLTEVFNSILNFFGTTVGRGDQILKETISNGTFGSTF